MGDIPNRKRTRIDSEIKTEEGVRQIPPPEYRNHPSLYFEDGNTILSCSSTLFCVHRTIVSKHSSVLKALLDSSDTLTLRGCRHVVIEENTEDFEALLNIIYEGLSIDISSLTIESSPLLSSILRMCTKYKVDRPCTEILQRIKAEWPDKLPEHDAKMVAQRVELARNNPLILRNGVNIPNPQYNPDLSTREDLIIHPGSVIALLRQCGYSSPDILTPLFYALSRGTWQFGGAAVGHHIAPLSHADIERFIIGIERLRTQHADFVVQPPALAQIPDHHKGTCDVGIRRYWSTLGPSMLKVTLEVRQPIEDWFAIIAQVQMNPNILASYTICADCAKLTITEMERRKQLLWSSMPGFFELLDS